MEGDDTKALRRQRLELVYQQAPATVLGAIAAVVLTGFVLRDQFPLTWILGWVGVTVAAYLSRGLAALQFRRMPPERRGDARWEQRYIAAVFACGVAWGIGGVVLFPVDSLAHQALLIVILGGVGAATTVSLSPLHKGGQAFVLAAVVPIGLRCLAEGGEIHIVLGALILVYAVTLTMAQQRTHGAVLYSLTLGQENVDLLDDLRAANERLTDAQRIAGFGNWTWELTTDTLQWSDETYRLFGVPLGEQLERRRCLALVHPDDRARVEAALAEGAAGRDDYSVDYRIVRAGGEVRMLHDEGELVSDPWGRPVRMAGVVHDITRRVAAEAKTRAALAELNRILNNLQDTYHRTDAEGLITHVSPSIEALLGYAPEACIGQKLADFYLHPGQWRLFLEDMRISGGMVQNYETPLRHRDGRRIWVSTNARFVYGEDGEVVGVEGTSRNVTELKQAREALRSLQERALATLQSIGDGVITTDAAGIIQYINPVAERLVGRDNAQATGHHYQDVLNLVDEGTGESLGDLVRLCFTREGGVIQANEGMLTQPDGTRFHIKVTAAPMHDRAGGLVGAVLALHDITEVMGMARQLSYQASHDMLTGLVNRREFERRLERAIEEAAAGDVSHVLFYLDLDQFKVVNDTCGHAAGDELLGQVAMLMHKQVRDTDTLARLGGDEFGVLLESCPVEKAVAIAEEIRAAIRGFRFVLGDKSFDIGVSIGVVPIDARSHGIADVLAAADTACYVAKDRGRNRVHLYQADDGAVVRHHGEMEWVHRISSAFDNRRFVLYAQPIINLDGKDVTSHYEVLLRMVDQKGKVVPPGAFIPAAERYNLMPTLDRWVLRNAFTLMRQAQGSAAFPPVNCAVNISGQSLNDDSFLDYVVGLFDETELPPESISFEITETAAIANLPRATRFIAVLRDLGCRFALDDFGAGLSSFGYLKNLAVDYLKIDGFFVKNMVRDRVDRVMVESINQVGHAMGLKTIAEFAEDEATVDALRAIGVNYAQGNSIARPILFVKVLAKYGDLAPII